ncbi:MAG TPA: GH25 family lysozyme [Lacibacter sp.]|nr:GH25 family lysozyme [Lacibacter sp.]HMO88371.1 GH25 family lysozyme [Lacibacter sp.]
MARSRKRKQAVRLRWLAGAVALSALLLFGYLWYANREAERMRYAAFGISLPARYGLHGIDVSHHQGRIHWKEVKAMRSGGIGLDFVFIKATEGTAHTDRQFRYNWKQSRRVELTRGAYHYFIPSRDGREQAAHFLRQVELLPGDLPPVLDVEQTNGVPRELLRRRVRDWLTQVETAVGVRPILYTNASFYENWLGSGFDEYPLWIAHYLQPKSPRTRRSWLFWQHSETGRVNGIRLPVDFNVFNGDSTAFRSLLLVGP